MVGGARSVEAVARLARRTLLPEDVPALLVRAGLLDSSICMGSFECRDESRRNRVFKVICEHAPSLLLKQPGPMSSASLLDSEAHFLRLAGEAKGLVSLAPYVPVLKWFSETENLLVTQLVNPATNYTKLHLNEGQPEFQEDAAAIAGEILAHVHQPREALPALTPEMEKPRSAPMNAIPEENFGLGPRREGLSNALLDLLARTDAIPWLGERSQEIRRGWTRTHLMHGDARWDNFLVGNDPDDPDSLRVILIDWEFVNWGDPAWDVAMFVAEYTRFWGFFVQDAKTPGKEGAEPWSLDPSLKARFEGKAYFGSMAAFLGAYARTAGLDGPQVRDLRGRVLAMLPFAILRTAIESATLAQELGPGHHALLHLVSHAHGVTPATEAMYKPLLEWGSE